MVRHSAYKLFLLFCLGLFFSCGNADFGFLTFRLAWPSSHLTTQQPSNQFSPAADYASVATIRVSLWQGLFRAKEVSFEYSRHEAELSVHSGKYLFRVEGLDSSGSIIFRGEQPSVLVSKDKTTDLGEITLASVGHASGQWTALAAGYSHACGIDPSGGLWCWGGSSHGQIGDGIAGGDKNIPTLVVSDVVWLNVSAGSDHTCGIKADSTLWCWGRNDSGQLGLGTSDADGGLPAQVAGGWSIVSAGCGHTCGIKSDGTLWCWGRNDSGELGIGDSGADQNLPSQVTSANDWLSISTGCHHTCGIKADTSLWCWGNNNSGQLGDGTWSNEKSPVSVSIGYSQVSGGNVHTCGIIPDGSLYCWGENENGQLGDGSGDNQNTPTQIGANNFTVVAAGYSHTCGITSEGSFCCWGNNEYGQLGNGNWESQDTPSCLGGSSDWKTISAGSGYTCGLKVSGAIWCWGRNDYGQMGDGTWESKPSPTQIK